MPPGGFPSGLGTHLGCSGESALTLLESYGPSRHLTHHHAYGIRAPHDDDAPVQNHGLYRAVACSSSQWFSSSAPTLWQRVAT
eukprot:symbB.v1.2.005791.t1/scaffold317.1/size229983/2